MIALAWWQGLLGGLGHVLAWLYELIPNYGVAIILLTIGIRLVLLPLGVKQIRSMQAMAALQPQMKKLQQQYKGNRAKLNEETQKLYRDAGVNPLAGCLPLLLQLPVLIALYSVLRFPANVGAPLQTDSAAVPGSHIPVTSRLYDDIYTQSNGVHFLGTNLLCSAAQAGKSVSLTDKHGTAFVAPRGTPNAGDKLNLNCGHGTPVRIPYYLLAVLMVATTFYQQRQMTRASPTPNQQQQALTRIMPLLFGVWGFLFPAGLVVYWTTSNLWQIGQQHFMLRAQGKQAPAGDGKAAPIARPTKPARQGFFASLMDRAAQADQTRRQPGSGASRAGSAGGKSGSAGSKSGTSKPTSAAKDTPSRRPTPSGGRNAGNRKKRRKR